LFVLDGASVQCGACEADAGCRRERQCARRYRSMTAAITGFTRVQQVPETLLATIPELAA
jgi:hypothetical protein